MAEPFLGEIRIFGFNFAPQGWAMCDGQLLSIQQNTALFALLGTTYGGDGVQTFALPDLRGRRAIHQGQGSGTSTYNPGQSGGAEHATLQVTNMPAHSHNVVCRGAAGNKNTPVGNFPSKDAGNQSATYATAADGNVMNAGTIQSSGGSQPFGILAPYLTTNFCIALQGIFPSRP